MLRLLLERNLISHEMDPATNSILESINSPTRTEGEQIHA
jgi:hypothetical protein